MADQPFDGGPAFPNLVASTQDREVITHESQGGMSLRDYFAAHAPMCPWPCKTHPDEALQQATEWAYAYADSMLRARAPSTGEQPASGEAA